VAAEFGRLLPAATRSGASYVAATLARATAVVAAAPALTGATLTGAAFAAATIFPTAALAGAAFAAAATIVPASAGAATFGLAAALTGAALTTASASAVVPAAPPAREGATDRGTVFPEARQPENEQRHEADRQDAEESALHADTPFRPDGRRSQGLRKPSNLHARIRSIESGCLTALRAAVRTLI
jgi:hypothetical protein